MEYLVRMETVINAANEIAAEDAVTEALEGNLYVDIVEVKELEYAAN